MQWLKHTFYENLYICDHYLYITNFHKKTDTLAEVLDNVFFTKDDEKHAMKFDTSSFITPPDESDNLLSEEDSTDENYTEFDIKRLGRKLN